MNDKKEASNKFINAALFALLSAIFMILNVLLDLNFSSINPLLIFISLITFLLYIYNWVWFFKSRKLKEKAPKKKIIFLAFNIALIIVAVLTLLEEL